MKTLLLLLLVCPLCTWAQLDTLRSARPDTLRPIGSDLVPGYYGGRYGYGRSVRTQYTYDGIDVRRANDLEKYIRASGDVDANAEFDRYLNRQGSGKVLIVAGSIIAMVGIVVMSSNRPDNDGKFTTTQQLPPPSPGVRYLGSNTITVPDKQRQNAYSGGFLTLLGGAVMAGFGVLMQMPGQHVRRAVQYYNRALKQRGVSWQLQPYSTLSNSGVGLVGRF